MTETGGERVDGPRLPDRSVDDVTRFHLEKSLTPTQIQIQMQLEMDAAAERHVHSPLLSEDLPAFEPPTLLKVRGLGFIWIALRVMTTLWAIGLGIAAILVRREAESGFSDGSKVATVGFFGALIAYALIVVGAFWSVRLTSNVHRLEGRYPTRNRAVRAWLYPGLWAGLMALTLIRAEPNPDFDIRPMIIVTGFMITMWRPYSLVRRIFLSLTRTSVDALVGVLYVLDVAGFGLVWWRVANWPDVLTPRNSGTSDVMLGFAFAAAVAFAAATLVVILLVRAAEAGQAHRMVVLRTRHDHRIARTLGLDPLDEAVRWALVEVRRLQEARAEAAAVVEAPYADRSVDALERVGTGSVTVAVGAGRVDQVDVADADGGHPEARGDEAAEIDATLVDDTVDTVDTVEVGTVEVDTIEVEVDTATVVEDDRGAPAIGGPLVRADAVDVVDEIVETVDDRVDAPAGEFVDDESTVDAEAQAETEPEPDPFADVVGVENRLAARMAAAEAEHGDEGKKAEERAARLAARIGHEDRPHRGSKQSSGPNGLRDRVAGATGESAPEGSPDGSPSTVPHTPNVDTEPAEHADVAASTEQRPEPVTSDSVEEKPSDQSLAARLAARLSDPSVVMSSAERKLALDLTPATPDRRVEELSSRLTDFDPVGDELTVGRDTADSLKALVDRYKLDNPPQSVNSSRDGSRFVVDGIEIALEDVERLTPPRVYPLEATRYAMLLAFGLATFGFGWIVLRSVDTEASLELGKLSPIDVARIDSARRAALTALSASLPLVALWSFVISVYSRRAGVANVRPRWCAGLFVVSAVITLAAQVTDGAERGTISLVAFFLSVAVAAAALFMVTPISTWFERSTVTTLLWATAMPLLVVLTWISGMQRSIVSEDSLEKLAFFGVIQALGAGLITVLAAITMVDLEDGLRSSIELAEPHQSTTAHANALADDDATATPAGVS